MNSQSPKLGASPAKGETLVETNRLRIERHDSPAAIEREWRQLEASGIGTVFQRYDWAAAYARNVLPHENARPAILLGRLDGYPAFVLPLALSKQGGVTTAHWIGGNHAGYNFGLWSPEGAAAIGSLPASRMEKLIGAALGDADCAMLQRVPAIYEGTRQPLSAMASLPSSASGYSFALEGGFDALLEARGGGQRRRKMRYKERKLGEAGTLECGTLRDPGKARAALDFFGEHKAVRLAEQGKPNSFARPGVMDFFAELLERSRGLNEPLLELTALSVGGVTRAVAGSGIHRGRINVYFMTLAHDELTQFSPGQVLTYNHIEESCERGLSDYDLGVGFEPYKTAWCDREHPLIDGYMGFTSTGKAAVAAVKLAERAKHRLRRNPALWQGLTAMRRRLYQNTRGLRQ